MSVSRVNRVLEQMQLAPLPVSAAAAEKKENASGAQTLTVIDNRTGKKIEMPIKNNTVVATKFLDFGLKSVTHKQRASVASERASQMRKKKDSLQPTKNERNAQPQRTRH